VRDKRRKFSVFLYDLNKVQLEAGSSDEEVTDDEVDPQA
jgi:hypothetical protein